MGKQQPRDQGSFEIRRQVVVKQPPERAFELFTEGLGDWWPLETHAQSGEAVDCGMDCHEGGKVFEVDAKGRRTDWGTLVAWEPPHLLRIEWVPDEAQAQVVEVRFAEHPVGSRVVLSSMPHVSSMSAESRRDESGTEDRAAKSRLEVDGFLGRAGELMESGDLLGALELARTARRIARMAQRDDLIRSADRTRCAAILVAGRARWVLRALKRQLDEPLEPTESLRVHYQLSLAYETLKEPRKARFYSQSALLLARDTSDEHWLIACLNQQGNVLLAEGDAGAAEEYYRESLGLLDASHRAERHQIVCNLGYCALLTDDPRRAIQLLQSSLSGWRRLGCERHEILPRLDLAQAYLALRRYGKAVRQGRAAYELAKRYRDDVAVTRALFLLGECGTGLGDRELARESRKGLKSQELLDSVQELIDLGIPLGFNEAINWRG